MGIRNAFLLGLTLGITLMAGCAGAYVKYYGMDGVRYSEGRLLGPDPKYDLPFSSCEPDAQFKKGKCVIMFYTDFQAYDTDCRDCKMRLDSCQRNCGGG